MCCSVKNKKTIFRGGKKKTLRRAEVADTCKKKKNKKEKKAYLYIFYTAFIGYAIELCIAEKKKFVNFF